MGIYVRMRARDARAPAYRDCIRVQKYTPHMPRVYVCVYICHQHAASGVARGGAQSTCVFVWCRPRQTAAPRITHSDRPRGQRNRDKHMRTHRKRANGMLSCARTRQAISRVFLVVIECVVCVCMSVCCCAGMFVVVVCLYHNAFRRTLESAGIRSTQHTHRN